MPLPRTSASIDDLDYLARSGINQNQPRNRSRSRSDSAGQLQSLEALQLLTTRRWPKLQPNRPSWRHRPAAQGRFAIIGCVAHRRMPLQKLDDLRAGKRLIFEETLGKRFEILAFLGNNPCCVGKARLNQT